MKVAVSIPDEIFEEAEQLAERLGKSRSRLYAEAIAEHLKDHRFDGITERLDAVYSVNNSTMDPSLEQAQGEILDDEGW
ncbi:MAG: hypothetical protein R3200_11440 [Xanthomonadales bacterium]|nr:hypothetical protein [Xanthomonadales bacterium]